VIRISQGGSEISRSIQYFEDANYNHCSLVHSMSLRVAENISFKETLYRMANVLPLWMFSEKIHAQALFSMTNDVLRCSISLSGDLCPLGQTKSVSVPVLLRRLSVLLIETFTCPQGVNSFGSESEIASVVSQHLNEVFGETVAGALRAIRHVEWSYVGSIHYEDG
jgi:hypothetical protein